MSDRCKVSICIPTRNRAGYLKESLGSALAQTFADIEVVVVDNASTDDTTEVVKSFRDERIRYYRNERDLGAFGNARRMIDLAEGEYIMVLFDDDYLSTNYVECMMEMARDDRVALAYGGQCIVDEGGRVLGERVPAGTLSLPGPEFLKLWVTGRMPLCVGSPTFTLASRLKAWVEEERFSHRDNTDNAFMVEMALGGRVALTDKCRLYYRKHGTSESRVMLWRETLASIRAFYEFIERDPVKTLWAQMGEADAREVRDGLDRMFVDQYLTRVVGPAAVPLPLVERCRALASFPPNRQYALQLAKYIYWRSRERLGRLRALMRSRGDDGGAAR